MPPLISTFLEYLNTMLYKISLKKMKKGHFISSTCVMQSAHLADINDLTHFVDINDLTHLADINGLL